MLSEAYFSKIFTFFILFLKIGIKRQNVFIDEGSQIDEFRGIRMNVILLILDALRYDHVTKNITPNLIKIAEEGAFFTHALSCNSATKASMPCILSSHKDYDPEKNIAAIARKHGYLTALIHSNPIVRPFSLGFEETLDIKSSKLHPRRGIWKKMRRTLPTSVVSGMKKVRAAFVDEEKFLPYARADETIDFALNWMEDNGGYFLWIHLMDPHIPYYPKETKLDVTRKDMIELHDKIIETARGNYQPTDEEIEMAKTLYREDIQEMDIDLGRFHDGFDDEDLLIITSDHGEEFYEYGQMSHPGNKIIPELIHVPLIFYGGGVKRNIIVEEYTSHLNIAPTILEALKIPEKLGIGKSLWKSLTE